jgi:hypothetical protein
VHIREEWRVLDAGDAIVGPRIARGGSTFELVVDEVMMAKCKGCRGVRASALVFLFVRRA